MREVGEGKLLRRGIIDAKSLGGNSVNAFRTRIPVSPEMGSVSSTEAKELMTAGGKGRVERKRTLI